MLILKVQFGRIEVNIFKIIIIKRSPGYFFFELLWILFLDAWLSPEGSYEIRSVCLLALPFIFPSVSFLGIGSLIFSETLHDVRGLYIVGCNRARFFEKYSHQAEMTKNGQKWLKKKSFGLFKQMISLVLS